MKTSLFWGGLVPHIRVELMIFCVRGRCPGPLDECGLMVSARLTTTPARRGDFSLEIGCKSTNIFETGKKKFILKYKVQSLKLVFSILLIKYFSAKLPLIPVRGGAEGPDKGIFRLSIEQVFRRNRRSDAVHRYSQRRPED